MRTTSASFRTRYLLGLLAALAILLFVGAAVNQGLREFITDAKWENRALDTIEQIGSVYTRVKDAESAQRGYLITGNDDYLGEFELGRHELLRRTEALLLSLADNPTQLERARTLARLSAQRIEVLEEVLGVYRSEGLPAAQERVASNVGKSVMDEITVLVSQMVLDEREVLERRRQASDVSSEWLQWVALSGIGTSIGLLCLLFGLILRENGVRLRAERRSEEAGVALADKLIQLRSITASTNELRNYAGMLQSCHSLAEAIQVTRQSLLNLLPEWRGSVYLSRASQDFAEQKLSWGEQGAQTTPLLPLDQCWALRRGQIYPVADLLHGNRCQHVVEPASPEVTATLCVPLNAQSETLGLLYLSSTRQNVDAAQILALSVAEQLSLALFNLRLQETLRLQSIRDPLTGLFNRRYLEESLAREIIRCDRRNMPLSVMMFDIDNFKRFNDSHGHDGGDALLRGFAETLRNHCRAEDIPCRYGGEEFTLIMPEADIDTAASRAEQLRHAVESMRVVYLKQPLSNVTISIGIACMPAHGRTLEDLVRNADAALYRAKNAGRNRVESA